MSLKLLDLFCGPGGAGMGYHRAGFEVTGIDFKPQPHYPFKFIQADALDYVAQYGWMYDAIHASPPCQAHTRLRNIHNIERIDLIPHTRFILRSLEIPYVIENTEDAPLQNPCRLCGSQFGLKVYRHRLFESNVLLFEPPHYPHDDDMPAAGRGMSSKGFVTVSGNGGFGFLNGFEYAKKAMGIDWMLRTEISQAIPPAYTEFIGKQLIAAIRNKRPYVA